MVSRRAIELFLITALAMVGAACGGSGTAEPEAQESESRDNPAAIEESGVEAEQQQEVPTDAEEAAESGETENETDKEEGESETEEKD